MAILYPIFKKGDLILVSNYRGISLPDIRYKVFTALVMDWIRPYATDIVGKYQCGFKRRKSTIDHIQTTRQLAKKHCEYNKEIHLVFIDFKQASDSIDNNYVKFWDVLFIYQKYIDLICT